MKRKIISLFLVFIIALGCIACDCSSEESNVNVWTAYGSEKILRHDDYSARYENKTLSISAFKNEREAGQIIISADKEERENVDSYTITLNDLTNASGEVLSKDLWTVYNQKYIYVSTVYNTLSSLEPGYYPDVLLPMQTAIDYKENNIVWEEGKENANQGIWLEVRPSKDLSAGVYTGSFQLDVDGSIIDVPVSVEIYDYTLGDYTHLKSSFGLEPGQIANAELDSTVEMVETYYEMLLNHRINPQTLLVSEGSDAQLSNPEVMELFLDKAVEAAMDDRWTSFNIAYESTATNLYYVYDDKGNKDKIFTLQHRWDSENEQDVWDITFEMARSTLPEGEKAVTPQEAEYARVNGVMENTTVVNMEVYEDTLIQMALRGLQESVKNITDASVTKPVDIMKKAATYVMFYDEFQAGDRDGTANYCQEYMWRTNQKVAEAIENETGELASFTLSASERTAFYNKYGITFEEYKQTIADECRAMKHKTTAGIGTQFLTKHSCLVPVVPKLDSDEAAEDYFEFSTESYGAGNEEVWTYICNYPNTPYTTLHIDDYLISSRLYGWLMYQYNIVGHLEWAAIFNSKATLATGGRHNQLMDYFGDASRWPLTNGEGTIIYSGREYGIYGPIESIRLKSLCDGTEDYDLLYELEEKYKERGVSGDSFDNVYELIFDRLHNNMKINHSDTLLDNFYGSRKELANLLSGAYSDMGLIFENYETSLGKGYATVSAKEGVSITCNGQTVTGETLTDVNGNSFVRYQFEISLDNDVNYVDIVAEFNGEQRQIKLSVGGRSVVYTGNSVKDNISFYGNSTGTVTTDVIDGENVTVIEFNAKDEPFQVAEFNTASYKFDKTVKTLKINLYIESIPNDIAKVNLEFKCRTTERTVVTTLFGENLAPGWHQIELNIGGMTFNSDADVLSFMRLSFNTAGSFRIAIGNIEVGGYL